VGGTRGVNAAGPERACGGIPKSLAEKGVSDFSGL
jgi:hypothetical protein